MLHVHLQILVLTILPKDLNDLCDHNLKLASRNTLKPLSGKIPPTLMVEAIFPDIGHISRLLRKCFNLP